MATSAQIEKMELSPPYGVGLTFVKQSPWYPVKPDASMQISLEGPADERPIPFAGAARMAIVAKALDGA
jgi:hypothetical protein